MAHPQPWRQPRLSNGHSARRWAEQGLRQEQSLSAGCLVTLMENELWGPNHRNHPLGWLAGPSESPSALAEGGALQKGHARRVGGGRDGQTSMEPRQGLDLGLDLLTAWVVGAHKAQSSVLA